MRKCAGCGEMFPKSELARIVSTPEGEVLYDPTGKLNGRGVYVCKNETCIARFKKTGAVKRALGKEDDGTALKELEGEL